MKKLLTYFATLIIFAGMIKAQITVTSSDFESQLQLGNEIQSFWDSTRTSINIGSTGEFNVDFSDLVPQAEFTTLSIPVAGSDYASDFPGAEYCSYYEGTFEGTFSKTWVYTSIDGSYFLHGTATEANTNQGNVKATTKYSPNRNFYQLPFTLGTAWNYTGEQEVATEVSGFPFMITSDLEAVNTVDGYGTMKMPDGRTVECLRVKVVQTLSTEVVPGFPTVSTSVRYEFIAKTGDVVTVSAADENQPDNGTIQIVSVDWAYGDGTSDVEPTEIIAVDYSLKQNYPNPFNPSTVIEFSIPKSADVELKVYNVLGKEVATLVNEFLPSGSYKADFNADNLPSGIYLAQIKAGNFSKAIKMTLLK